MREAAPALLLGRGELDRIERTLEQLGVDCERIDAPRSTMRLAPPTRLLVVSGHCLSRMPTFLGGEGAHPMRVCIHGQDFLPLRERLRELGFHYLVQSALDETSLHVFLAQVLHPGAGQRRTPRLPLGGPVEYRSGRASGDARLADLSAESCRILGARELRLDDTVTLVLPAPLGGGMPLPLHGHVIRAGVESAGGESGSSTVIRFGVLEDDARERLGRLVRGELIGARVTPLAEAPFAEDPPPAVPREPETPAQPEGAVDRRREVRYPYRGRVDVLELPGNAAGVLGRDLSLEGVCIQSGHGLRTGMKVTLALFGGRRPEPVVVEAEAVRVTPDEAALVFGRLSEAQQDKLAALITEQPALESLEASERGGRIVATRVLDRRS